MMNDLNIKIINNFSMFFLNCAIYLIAIAPPSTGYELSIYNAYPIYLPIIIILSFSVVFGSYWIEYISRK